MNQVRIIAGQWRRRLLRFPDRPDLRPTPDRVRETLFNWLGQDLTGLSCLDLFAGSGALGFEAASRGAARVVLIEKSLPALQALENNIHLLQAAEIIQVVRRDALEFSRFSGHPPFDVLFLDPPFRMNWIDKFAPLLAGLVKETGRLYVEAEYAISNIGDWQTLKSGRAGQVHYHLLAHTAHLSAA